MCKWVDSTRFKISCACDLKFHRRGIWIAEGFPFYLFFQSFVLCDLYQYLVTVFCVSSGNDFRTPPHFNRKFPRACVVQMRVPVTLYPPCFSLIYSFERLKIEKGVRKKKTEWKSFFHAESIQGKLGNNFTKIPYNPKIQNPPDRSKSSTGKVEKENIIYVLTSSPSGLSPKAENLS